MQKIMGANTTVVVADRQVSGKVAGEVMILGLKRGGYYGLQGVGALIWELIQTPCRVSDLCVAVRERYEVGEAQCAADVAALLNDLIAQGLASVVAS